MLIFALAACAFGVISKHSIKMVSFLVSLVHSSKNLYLLVVPGEIRVVFAFFFSLPEFDSTIHLIRNYIFLPFPVVLVTNNSLEYSLGVYLGDTSPNFMD